VIRLIALDVDGTLLDSQWRVPEANRLAIERAVARGIEVALVTGRRFDFARPVFDALPDPLTLILNNGAIVKTRDGETVQAHLLPREIACRVLDMTRQFRDTVAVVFDRPRAEQLFVERAGQIPLPPRARSFRSRNEVTEVTELKTCLVVDPIQLMFFGEFARMRELAAMLQGPGIDLPFSLAITEYESRDLALVDVVRAGCSKGAALIEWSARRGLDRSQVMAVGDNLNDLEMLEFAGQPVVMGNAVAALKESGWPVTGTNDEAGVAAAIEAYALVE
jgi:Cof subfamily protein (haloacid dehalogenase superfamily)